MANKETTAKAPYLHHSSFHVYRKNVMYENEIDIRMEECITQTKTLT